MPDRNLRSLSFWPQTLHSASDERPAANGPRQAGRKSAAEPNDNSNLQRAFYQKDTQMAQGKGSKFTRRGRSRSRSVCEFSAPSHMCIGPTTASSS